MDQSGKLEERDALKAVGDGFKKTPADAVSTTFLNQ